MTVKLIIYGILISLMLAVWLTPDAAASRIIVVVALIIGAIGSLAAFTSPNGQDHIFGAIIIGFASLVLVMAISGYLQPARWLLIGAMALSMALYAIPLSTWRTLGVGEQPGSDTFDGGNDNG